MGMTEVRSYCMRIIGNISMILYQIPTRLGTEMCYNEVFKCSKLQFDQSMYFYFMADFAKCAKSRSRNFQPN